MAYEDFRLSSAGRAVNGLLADATTLARMEELAGHGVPPVKVIDAALPERVRLTNTEKQFVGIMVRDALASAGWRVAGQRRFAGGRQFVSGSWYQRRRDRAADLPNELLPFRERLERARAIIRAAGASEYGVDDFLRDKREEAAREDAKYARPARDA